MSVAAATMASMTTFEAWREQRALADARAAAAAADVAAQLTELAPGLWLVSVLGATRGDVTRISVRGEVRFQARLRHLEPGHGLRVGEFWKLEHAVAAVVAAVPPVPGRDPFAELVAYASREQMLQRTLRAERRRRRGSIR